jgi:hypothetical protein
MTVHFIRAKISSTLLSSSTPQQQLAELSPYVKLGDRISDVHHRIAPLPDEDLQIERPTEHSYGLGESNLVLAIDANGTVIGIGRHKNGIDDGTVWLSPPNWSGS